MRLTERKVCYPQCDNQENLTKIDYIEIKDKKLAEEKLCQLEDIEDELGIDLITLFKVLKDGADFTGKNDKVMGIPFKHIEHSPHLLYGFFEQKWRLLASGYERKVSDYGKTWTLIQEELL